MLNIVLVEPEIPQNTGNIARTCACIGATLHLIEPMGFRLSARNVARAGCDYWDKVEIIRWTCLDEFMKAHGDAELHMFTGHVKTLYTDVEYGTDAFLLFGSESRGLPEDLIDCNPDLCVRIPMKEGLRSLNLSNAVAIGAYEAIRQHGFFGLE
ncbi:MAG: tRNA (cytidine(34)-2'-O)-methyltransferase [Eggerthellaceae bacterium]|nr:tRNA (cytidine(34)-2'-O)-methyltransferase [Eggerthellaceae bacterium]